MDPTLVVTALVVGLSLGLLGGGGSILAVPVLHYAAGLEASEAAPVALLTVATTAAVAMVGHAHAGRVRWGRGLSFGAAAMVGGFAGGRAARLLSDHVILLGFSAVALVSAITMLLPRPGGASQRRPAGAVTMSMLGVATGAITSAVGAGGGFLIVPALTSLGGMVMQEAIGTSLLVITMNALAGVAGHGVGQGFPWSIALPFCGLALVGAVAGLFLAGRLPARTLRRVFAGLIGLVGLAVLVGEWPRA